MRILAFVPLLLLAGCTLMDHDTHPLPDEPSNSDIVLTVLQRGLAGDEDVINRYVAEDYKQHNPMAEDGRAGLLGFVRSLKGVPFKIKVARVLTDGDFVAVHSDVWFGDSHSAVFDLFIVRDGMLREHWDCIQAVPEQTLSGRGMTDGPTEITDLDKTEANRKLIKDFQEAVIGKADQNATAKFFSEQMYKEHDADLAEFPLPWRPGWDKREEWHSRGAHSIGGQRPEFEMVKAHRIIAEGNFVLVQGECSIERKQAALYQLFRIENGKIVEHWDTIQEVPATSKNKNGMF